MPFLEKLKNIFASDGKRKSKQPSYSRQDVDPGDLWDILGELGDGAFGKVYKAKRKVEGFEAALKLVEIKTETDLEDFGIEIDILRLCKHKNIVSLFESYFYANKLWMYMEFCGGGALDSIMVDLEKGLTEPQIQFVCREMCEGLDFLHQNFVIHRDLKAGNVLLTIDGQVKLADFGVSAKNTSIRQTRDTFIGTPYWMAPEVILCETMKDCPYSFKADIWSFGITLIELAEIQPPNYELHPLRVLIKIQKAPPPVLKIQKKWSTGFRDFIAKCLVKDPDSRLTAAELLEHRFISNVSCNDPILELLSEVKADVILEENELDDANDDEFNSIINEDDSVGDVFDINDSESNNSLSVITDETEETDSGNPVSAVLDEPNEQIEVKSTADLDDTRAMSESLHICNAEQSLDEKDITRPTETDTNIIRKQESSVHIAEQQPKDEASLGKTEVDEALGTAVNLEKQSSFEMAVDDDASSMKPGTAPTICEEQLPSISVVRKSVTDSSVGLGLSLDSGAEIEAASETADIKMENRKSESEDFRKSVDVQNSCKESGESRFESAVSNDIHLEKLRDDDGLEERNDTKLTDCVIDNCDTSRQFDALECNSSVEESSKLQSLHECNNKPSDVDLVGNSHSSDNITDEGSKLTDAGDPVKSDSEIIFNIADSSVVMNSFLNEDHRNTDIETTDDLTVDDDSNKFIPNDVHHKRDDYDDKKSDEETVLFNSDQRNDKPIDCDSVSNARFADSNKDEKKKVDQVGCNEIKNIVGCNQIVHEDSKRINEDPKSLSLNSSTIKDSTDYKEQDDVIVRNGLNQSVTIVHDQPNPVIAKESSSGNKDTSSLTATEICVDDVPNDISSKKTEAENSVTAPKFKQNKSKVTIRADNKFDIAATTETDADPADTSATKVDVTSDKKMINPEDQRKQFRTLTKTRTFVINGVVVKSQTSRVVLSGTENRKQQEHDLWKADLRELKRLQKEENRQLQMTDLSAQAALEELEKRHKMEIQALNRNYDLELDQLSKQRIKVLDKMISSQNSEYKALQKKVKAEQERDLKHLHELLKQERKLWKQGMEMLPKPLRKDMMAKKKEEKEIELAEKERNFLEEQHDKSEQALKRLSDQHRDKVILLDKQFLQQKHQILKVKLSRIIELEERHVKEKYEISFLQLKNKFILKRQLMMQRNNRELEQMKRINSNKLQQLLQRQALEMRRLPKTLKSDAKTRHLMYKESLRISFLGATAEQEKEKMKKFEENEKQRRKQEIQRVENKHKNQLDDLNSKNDAHLKELEEMHTEKQNLLSAHQEQKEKDLKNTFDAEMAKNKTEAEPRFQKFDEECSKEISEHEGFYSQDTNALLRVSSQRSLTGSIRSSSSVKSGHSFKSSYRGSLIM